MATDKDKMVPPQSDAATTDTLRAAAGSVTDTTAEEQDAVRDMKPERYNNALQEAFYGKGQKGGYRGVLKPGMATPSTEWIRTQQDAGVAPEAAAKTWVSEQEAAAK